MNRIAISLALLAAAAANSGCSVAPPKPWQKGLLARPEMTMAPDPLEEKLNEHTYTSKEGASGGFGVGGGGCGCG